MGWLGLKSVSLSLQFISQAICSQVLCPEVTLRLGPIPKRSQVCQKMRCVSPLRSHLILTTSSSISPHTDEEMGPEGADSPSPGL